MSLRINRLLNPTIKGWQADYPADSKRRSLWTLEYPNSVKTHNNLEMPTISFINLHIMGISGETEMTTLLDQEELFSEGTLHIFRFDEIKTILSMGLYILSPSSFTHKHKPNPTVSPFALAESQDKNTCQTKTINYAALLNLSQLYSLYVSQSF